MTEPTAGPLLALVATDGDLWGTGARQWLRIVRGYVRQGQHEHFAAHRTMKRCFAEHWPTLVLETWQPLMRQARQRGAYVWGAGMRDWRHGFLAIALETAYWWGFECETDLNHSQELWGAVNELRGINREVGELAGRMADLLKRGTELRSRFSLDVEWTEPGPDLWGLLGDVAQRFPSTAGDCQELAAAIRYMRGTTRRTPELVDLMDVLATCEPGDPIALQAADAEALRMRQGTARGDWPERVRQLFATFADPRHKWRDGGCEVTMLDCFDAQSLATLACVAVGLDPHGNHPSALGRDAIEKALQRYRERSRFTTE